MKFTNRYDLPSPIPQAVMDAEAGGPPVEFNGKPVLRVSSLIDSPRRVQLTQRHYDEITVDVSECLYTLQGTVIHNILQHAAWAPGYVTEERIFQEVNGVYLSGQIDLYESRAARVTDYKNTAIRGISDGVKDEWEAQVNVYAWLERKAGREVREARIVAFLRDHVGRRSVERDYPDVPMAVLPVELWTEQAASDAIDLRVRSHKAAASKSDDDLPICEPEERWHKPDTWAVKKKGQKRAVRVFDSEAGAYDFYYGREPNHVVEHRPGEDVRCESYCRVNKWCSYWLDKQK